MFLYAGHVHLLEQGNTVSACKDSELGTVPGNSSPICLLIHLSNSYSSFKRLLVFPQTRSKLFSRWQNLVGHTCFRYVAESVQHRLQDLLYAVCSLWIPFLIYQNIPILIEIILKSKCKINHLFIIIYYLLSITSSLDRAFKISQTIFRETIT